MFVKGDLKLTPLKDLLEITMEHNASDLHLTVGVPPVIRSNGELKQIGNEKLYPLNTENYAREILGDVYEEYLRLGEMDTSFSAAGIGRFRVNIFKQRGSHAIAIRVVGLKIPTLNDLQFPNIVRELTNNKRGLVLVTGPTGSGKSTTLAAMINEINITRASHIITLEDPIEYLHKHTKSIINQREIGKDTLSYANALRSVLREDPDVILVGEMRDLETISVALTAAETGHLVLSTLHTIGAAKTIDRVVDVFPPHQQQQVKIQLAAVLKGIVSQQLLPKPDGKGRAAALEIMIATTAIQNMIREGKTHQVESSIQTGAKYGMKTMDMSLAELYKKGLISYETALSYAIDRDMLSKIISL
jgi:twitching motility protein PilT